MPALAAEVASPAEYNITIEETWIRIPDGVRLAADLFMPEGGAADERYPVLLEYHPYRKKKSRAGSYRLYSYFVARSYVVALVDIRGTGNSEGRLIPHEYSDIEQDDGVVCHTDRPQGELLQYNKAGPLRPALFVW